MSRKNKEDQLDFEGLLNELVQLVESMEHGGNSLDTSLKQFERGIELIGHCQKKLQDAEQRVQQLVQKEAKEVLVDYSNADNLDPNLHLEEKD